MKKLILLLLLVCAAFTLTIREDAPAEAVTAVPTIETGIMEIKKYGIPSELSEVNLVIDRYVKKDIEIATNDLFEMLNNEKFSEADFINFAKKLQVVMAPESYKAFFERLKNENSNATEAYLYALYELGMIDELREQIGLSDGDEHEKFNLLLFLKDNGKNVPASLIF